MERFITQQSTWYTVSVHWAIRASHLTPHCSLSELSSQGFLLPGLLTGSSIYSVLLSEVVRIVPMLSVSHSICT